MKKLFKNQSGFSHHFLLPILVIVAIAGIGSYLLTRSKAAVAPETVYDLKGQAALEAKAAEGVSYKGLKLVKKDAKHPCAGLFELTNIKQEDGFPMCTHGGESIPKKLKNQSEAEIDSRITQMAKKLSDVPSLSKSEISKLKKEDESAAYASKTALTCTDCIDHLDLTDLDRVFKTQDKCVGNGSDGKRVVFIYASVRGGTNRYPTFQPIMEDLARAMSGTFYFNSGQKKVLRIRHESSTNCRPVIYHEEISSVAGDDVEEFKRTVNELKAKGYDYTKNRKYVVWLDGNASATQTCGRGTLYMDRDHDPAHNDNDLKSGYTVVGRTCFSLGATIHEFMHNIGAVQNNSTNTDGLGHCNEEFDIVCYNTDSAFLGCSRDYLKISIYKVYNLDCHNDDYWDESRTNSYLSNNWNSYYSSYLTTY